MVDLPEEFKNVTSITVVSVQIPNSCYNFTSTLGTNEFTIELFDLSGSDVVTGSQQIKTVKISNGIYTGKQLESYLNTYVLSIAPLNRIGVNTMKSLENLDFLEIIDLLLMEDYLLILQG